MPKVNRTFRLDSELSKALDKICVRYGDKTYHVENALRAYAPIKQLTRQPIADLPVKPKDKAVAEMDGLLFENAWSLYGKKGNRKTSRTKFLKLPLSVQAKIIRRITSYVDSTPDKRYRKNFETYLNQECWNDEVINHEETKRTNQSGRPSVVDRVRSVNEQREQARRVEERALDGQAMGALAGDLRPPTEQPVRGNHAGELGEIIDGDFTRSD